MPIKEKWTYEIITAVGFAGIFKSIGFFEKSLSNVDSVMKW